MLVARRAVWLLLHGVIFKFLIARLLFLEQSVGISQVDSSQGHLLMNVSQNQTISYGKMLELNCSAFANTMKWKQQNKNLSLLSSTKCRNKTKDGKRLLSCSLTINLISDEATFLCTARKERQDGSKAVTVTVVPSVRIVNVTGNGCFVVGTRLTCKFSYHKEVSVWWEITDINNSSSILKTIDRRKENGKFELTIDAKRVGQYVCHVVAFSDKTAPGSSARVFVRDINIAISSLSNATELTCTACNADEIQWIGGPDNKTTIAKGTKNITLSVDNKTGRRTYTCVAQKRSKTVELVPSYITLKPKGSSAVLNTTGTSLYCNAFGRPPPSITWKRLNGSSAYDVQVTIPAADKSVVNSSLYVHGSKGRGTYICSVTNGLGSDEARAEVYAFSCISSMSQSSILNCSGSADLQCEGRGFPEVKVEWRGPKGEHVFTNSTVTGKNMATSTLEINRETARRNYTCVVSSSIGEVSKLYVISAMGCLEALSPFSVIEYSDKVILTCSASGSPSPPFPEWHRLRSASSRQSYEPTKLKQKLKQKQAFDSRPDGLPIRSSSVVVRWTRGAVYQCSIDGAVKTVTVYAKAAVTQLKAAYSSLKYGTETNLTCIADGYPKPTAMLYYPNGTQIYISGNSKAKPTVLFRLLLGGKYLCRVTNKILPNKTEAKNKSEITLQIQPEVLKPPKGVNVTLIDGESKNISCLAAGFPEPSITWTVEPEGSFKLTTTEQTSINTSTSLYTKVLKLKRVSLNQNGSRFTCTVRHGNLSDNGTIALFVWGSVKILKSPESTAVEAGESASFFCEASGASTKAISWFKRKSKNTKRGTNVTSSSKTLFNATAVQSTLTIRRVQLNDGGYYYCAVGTHSHPFLAVSEAAILGVGAVFISSAFTNSSAPVGKEVNLTCAVTGTPPLTLGWQYSFDTGNETFTATEKESVTERQKTFLIGTMPLLLTKRSAGYYRCWVLDIRNDTTYSNSTFLNVTYAPEALQRHYRLAICVKGIVCSLNCSFDSNPKATVQWQKDAELISNRTHKIFSIGNESVLQFLHSDFSISGLFWCSASNYVGTNRSGILLTVRGPPFPVKVNATTILSNRITITWTTTFDGNSPISHFDVSFATDENTIYAGTVQNYLPSSSISFTFLDLAPFTAYFVLVKAINNYGTSPDNRAVQIMTDVSSPSKVRNVTVTLISGNCCFISWLRPSEPNGNIDFYRVYYKETEIDAKRKTSRSADIPFKTVTGDKTSVVLKNLKSFKKYEIGVIAVNRNNRRQAVEGKFGNLIEAETREGAPSAPRNFSVNKVEDEENQLLIAWLEPLCPNGLIRLYDVFYQTSSQLLNENWQSTKARGRSTSLVLSNLSAYTDYAVKIRTVTILPGDNSTTLIGRTDEGWPSAPLEVHATLGENASTEIELQWNPPLYKRGVITNYQVTYNGTKLYSEGWEYHIISSHDRIRVAGEEHQLWLKDLQPDMSYNLSVSAFTKKGIGDESSLSIKTSMSDPIRPTAPSADPSLAAHSDGTLLVNLTQPSNKNGMISAVQLLVLELLSSGTDGIEELFHSANVTNFSVSKTSKPPHVYVAAQFEFHSIPRAFVVGDGKSVGGYWNRPLIPDQHYAIVLRSITVSREQILYSTSDFIILKTAQSSASSKVIAAVAVVLILLSIAVVVLIVLYLRKREKRRATEDMRNPNICANENETVEVVAMHNLNKETWISPSVRTEDTELSCLEEDTCILLVVVDGRPCPSVTWWKKGNQIREDERIQVLIGGSLLISNARPSDKGCYKCVVENALGNDRVNLELKIRSERQEGNEVWKSTA